MNETAKQWYEKDYISEGINAQRRYPNEELCRFMGRNFFKLNIQERENTKILEVGCGSGGNLWMIAQEGFDAYGCDLSETSIALSKEVLQKKGLDAHLTACDMISTPYSNSSFNSVVDVFSSYCLCRNDYLQFVEEMRRILIPSGIFFSYFPSKASDTYIRSTNESRIDNDTLIQNDDKESPYYGNLYPYRFMSRDDVQAIFTKNGFEVRRLESTGRTYNNGEEYFEWLVFEAVVYA